MTHKEIIESTFGLAVIYKLTSPSGKVYIGQTINFRDRYSVYKRRKKNSIGRKLFNALNKYGGIENFDVEILSRVTIIDDVLSLRETLKELEILFIKENKSFEHGYNLTEGGEGALGRILTDETKRKIGEANKGNGAVDDVEYVCSYCKKSFKVQPHILNSKLRRSTTGRIYCSAKCAAAMNRKTIMITDYCADCGKEIVTPRHKYNKRIKNGTTGKVFCGPGCARKYKIKQQSGAAVSLQDS